jgi:hypothetical protein
MLASPTILAGVAFVVISLHAVYRAQKRERAERAEREGQVVDLARQVDERAAELLARSGGRATLVVELALSDAEAIPDLPATAQRAQPLVSALSRQEQSLGGAGLVLTTVKIEPGSLRLTLSPVERIGSAERVRRVAEQWNATGGPLPPGVTAARADILAA